MSVKLTAILEHVKEIVADVPPLPGVEISCDIDFDCDNLVVNVSKGGGILITQRFRRRFLLESDLPAVANEVREFLAYAVSHDNEAAAAAAANGNGKDSNPWAKVLGE